MRKSKPRQISNQLRIIGGSFRGRKLPFPDVNGLRPTPDRVRETLFNWLQNEIVGARCLDLFAGSGALGIEALSRGASEVVFVERDKSAITQLKQNLQKLDCKHADLVHDDAMHFLTSVSTKPFNIVFLDPPFQQDLINPICDQLINNDWLQAGASVYIESEISLEKLSLPDNWSLRREKKAGQVCYRLFHLI